jgi:hypothetical protein
MSFTFEKDFSINYCNNGGYLLIQSNMVEKQHVRFERAFSDLCDLTDFLLAEKKKFLPPTSTGFIVEVGTAVK